MADRFGGQILDTLGIENFIGQSIQKVLNLRQALEAHVNEYDIDVMNVQRAKRLEKKDLIEVELENGAVLRVKPSSFQRVPAGVM